jgi:DNA modification methylase/ParB-like chromosome segregation protein Spo0J
VIEVARQEYIVLPLECIIPSLTVRRLSKSGLARIQESMQRLGFLDNYPLIITPLESGTYQLIDGKHRYESAKALGITPVPCIIKTDLSERERYKLALESNNAAENIVPSTLVTNAEFVWARVEEEYTQQEIGDMLGWSRDKVADYVSLKKIDSNAWAVIVATFEGVATIEVNGVATPIVASATFTEGLLRSILDLESEQQLELVTELATNKEFTKGKFKTLAENYQARNEMYDYALKQLGELGEPYTAQLEKEVYSGAYDAEWKKKEEHPKLDKLVRAISDEWERKNSIHLIHGDFSEEVKKLGDSCIDLILTDPPYNIANEREFEFEGRSSISQNFGEWDKYEHQTFIESLQGWVCEWARILKTNGTGYVFISDRYISHMREALLSSGLNVMTTITWHKTNPGTMVHKVNFKSSTEFILYFVKGKSEHTFNWQGENEMHNFIESPICGGNERRVDAKNKTLHPTQKPESVIHHLMDISSNKGDTVFDGFAGTGTTGKVAKDTGRKFIGIEQHKKFFEDMQRRLADE